MAETVIHSVGSRPSSSLEEWAKDDFSPVPVSYQIKPMTALFKPLFELWNPDGNLGAIEAPNGQKLNSTAINDFFRIMVEDYCEIILEQQNCPNSDPKGCGINDGCPFGTVCRDNVSLPTGYACDKGEAELNKYF